LHLRADHDLPLQVKEMGRSLIALFVDFCICDLALFLVTLACSLHWIASLSFHRKTRNTTLPAITMKIAATAALVSSCTSFLALGNLASAFSVSGALSRRTSGTSATTTTTALHATVERSTKLVPPPSIQDVTEHAQELYDSNVQKTYG
jgi:hypothetical protein